MSTAPIFVVGTPRSGTTLTSHIIGNHSFIFVAGPTHFLQDIYVRRHELGDPAESVAVRQAIVERLKSIYARYDIDTGQARIDRMFRETDIEGRLLAATSYREILVTFMESQMRWEGKSRWANHVPHDLFELQDIFTFFPDAKVVLCVRSLLDFLVSYRDMFKRAERLNKLGDADRLRQLYHPVVTSLLWTGSMRAVIGALDRWGDRLFMNRYEDLIDEPETRVRRLCEFLEIEFEPAMLTVETNNSSEYVTQRGIFATSIERWRGRLGESEAYLAQKIGRRELRRLGYTPVSMHPNLATVARLLLTAPVFALRALSANKSRVGPAIPYLTKRIAAFVRR
jgi:hypothetical protein